MIIRKMHDVSFHVPSPSHYICVETPVIQLLFNGIHWFLIIGKARAIPHTSVMEAAGHLKTMLDACLAGVPAIDAVMLG